MRKLILILFIVTSAVLCGCQKDKKTYPVDSVAIITQPAPDGFTADGGICKITIAATASWEAESTQSWARLADEYGDRGMKEVQVHVSPNVTGVARVAVITFYAGSVVATFTLTQNP